MKINAWFIVVILSLAFACADDDDDTSTDLKGEWVWQSSCGGFVGCVYTNSKDVKMLNIAAATLELNENGKITVADSYSVKSVNGDSRFKEYEIELGDGTVWALSIEHDVLTIETGIMTSIYKRYDD